MRDIGLAVDDCPSLQEEINYWGIYGRRLEGKGSNADAGIDAADVEGVLDGDGNAVKGA